MAKRARTPAPVEIDIQIERWPIKRLIPRANNPRTHSREQVANIAASIREFGWTNPVLVDGDDGILAGHARLLAAEKLAMKEVPVIVLRHLSPAQRRALVIADNQLAIAGAGWDEEMLRIELAILHEEDYNLDLVGFVRKKNAPWYGKPGENSTVWSCPSPKFIFSGSDKEEKFDHPTQKPMEVMRRPILNHTLPGEPLYDCFLGSGTTLIAAEQTGRVCFGVELDPKYIDVIVRCWQQYTGKQAVLDGDGRTFDEIAEERIGAAA